MNQTVLIVDDDDILRETLAHGLRREKFNIIGADSAEMATEILTKIKPDAIILDRMMTGMDGLTFLRTLRASGNNTPIIMLTAMTGPENAIDGLSGGADDYLAKPFQLRELILRLKNIISKHPQQTPQQMPANLTLIDGEFFVHAHTGDSDSPRLLTLSGAEKQLLTQLTCPIGNIVSASPMVAKRLRNKLNSVLSNLDIITVRGHGYKLIETAPVQPTNKDKA